MKTVKSTAGNPDAKKVPVKRSDEIKTDFPLSEKDEVKEAEKKLQQGAKKHS